MKKRISRIICTLLCCAPIAISAQTSEKITSPVNLYKEGKELFQEKNYAAAIPALKAFVKQKPTASLLQDAEYMLVSSAYELKDKNWPTINPKDPYALSIEEEDLMHRMLHSFECSEKLKKHMRCLFRHGSMYQVCNSNLLFHASVPMNADGTLKNICIEGQEYKGKALLDKVDQLIRTAYFDSEGSPEKDFALDYIWYLWGGKDSPLFDKSKMATFERAFIDDKEVQKEEKGAYYTLREEEKVCDMILDEFGVTGPHRHIINGHVPVRSIQGENPIKANGKLLVIDGGFSRPYHPETGIAGYTLVYHSRGFQLVQHEPFLSTDQAIKEGRDIRSTTIVVELSSHRQMVKDTDKGADLQRQIHDLEKLLYAYRNGFIKEKERSEY